MIRWINKQKLIPDLTHFETNQWWMNGGFEETMKAKKYGNIISWLCQPPPPFVTVADCGHCFEDVGERW